MTRGKMTIERMSGMTTRELFEYAAKRRRPLTLSAVLAGADDGGVVYWASVDRRAVKCSKCGRYEYPPAYSNSGSTFLEAARNTMRLAFFGRQS